VLTYGRPWAVGLATIAALHATITLVILNVAPNRIVRFDLLSHRDPVSCPQSSLSRSSMFRSCSIFCLAMVVSLKMIRSNHTGRICRSSQAGHSLMRTLSQRRRSWLPGTMNNRGFDEQLAHRFSNSLFTARRRNDDRLGRYSPNPERRSTTNADSSSSARNSKDGRVPRDYRPHDPVALYVIEEARFSYFVASACGE
jgi:hypothetical protein